jgi:hypothetical protein
MSTGQKRVWQTNDKWRILAFKRFRDSREWRYLLELNPTYDIRYHPAPGTEVHLTGPLSEGKTTPSGLGSVGTLIQPDVNLDLRTAPQTDPESQSPSIFPWDKEVEFIDRLGQYTALALLTPDRTNGFSLDSPQASSDTQRG